MDFKELYVNALISKKLNKKLFSIENYLPNFITTQSDITCDLPYVQAYASFDVKYPYYYELTHLDSYCLLFTEKGSATLNYGDRNYQLMPNSLAIINCMKNHRLEIEQTSWKYNVLFINGASISDLYEKITSNSGNLYSALSGSDIPNLVNNFHKQLSKNSTWQDYIFAKYIMDILLEIIIEQYKLKENSNIIPSYLIKIKQEFEKNYSNNITLDSIEQEFHINKYRICREFTEYFGTSPIHYLNEQRVNLAKEALINTDKRINEIGRMVGFENTNHFIRMFKQQTGITPLNYRSLFYKKRL